MSVHRVLDSSARWRALDTILPVPPDPSDLRGVTIPFHGRYRGAHNTGVPTVSALNPPRLGGTFSTNNATFNDEHFIGECDITGTGITFNRCLFESNGGLYAVNATVAATFNDCSIYGGRYFTTHAAATGVLLLNRCKLWGGSADILDPTGGTACLDSYLYGADVHFGTHSDTVQTAGGNNVFIKRCKLLAYFTYSTTYIANSVGELGTNGPNMDNFQFIDNYVNGGGACLNGSLSVSQVTNALLDGNRWGRNFAATPVVTALRITAPFGSFTSNNVYDDTGVAV